MSVTQDIALKGTTHKKRPVARAAEQLSPIGDVAREFGVTLRTLRFYEDKGLLSPYRDGSARLYRASDRARIALILKGKKLGFTLGEIRESIATAAGSRTTLSLKPEQIKSQIDHLCRQRDDIDAAIAQLKSTSTRAQKSIG